MKCSAEEKAALKFFVVRFGILLIHKYFTFLGTGGKQQLTVYYQLSDTKSLVCNRVAQSGTCSSGRLTG